MKKIKFVLLIVYALALSAYGQDIKVADFETSGITPALAGSSAGTFTSGVANPVWTNTVLSVTSAFNISSQAGSFVPDGSGTTAFFAFTTSSAINTTTNKNGILSFQIVATSAGINYSVSLYDNSNNLIHEFPYKVNYSNVWVPISINVTAYGNANVSKVQFNFTSTGGNLSTNAISLDNVYFIHDKSTLYYENFGPYGTGTHDNTVLNSSSTSTWLSSTVSGISVTGIVGLMDYLGSNSYHNASGVGGIRFNSATNGITIAGINIAGYTTLGFSFGMESEQYCGSPAAAPACQPFGNNLHNVYASIDGGPWVALSMDYMGYMTTWNSKMVDKQWVRVTFPIATTGSTLAISMTDKNSWAQVDFDDFAVGGDAILVSSLVVSEASGSSVITTNGAHLQFSASVLPTNAKNQGVNWSVVAANNTTGRATITSGGVLRAVTNGVVQVKATAIDGGAVVGTYLVTITGQKQNLIVADLETVFPSYTYVWDGSVTTLTSIVNPVKSGINTSNDVYAFYKTSTGDYKAGVIAFDPIDAYEHPAIEFMLYSPVTGTMGVTVYDASHDINEYTTFTVTEANIWQRYSINASTNVTTSGVFTPTQLILPTTGFGVGTFYLDNIRFLAPLVSVTSISLSVAGGGAALINSSVTGSNTLAFAASFLPTNADSTTVTWSVDNYNGSADISSMGVITAVGNGLINVIATSNDGFGTQGMITVTISGQPASTVTDVSIAGLNGVSVISVAGGSLQMVKTILPTNAAKGVVWSVTSVTGVAGIDQTGLLSAMPYFDNSNGTVTVRATASDGSNVYGETTVTISNQPTARVSAIALSTEEGGSSISSKSETLQLLAAVTPAGALQPVTWSVIGTAATINSEGLLTGEDTGVVTVVGTATDDSGVTGTLVVTVTITEILALDWEVAATKPLYMYTWNHTTGSINTIANPVKSVLNPSDTVCDLTITTQADWSNTIAAKFQSAVDLYYTPILYYKLYSPATSVAINGSLYNDADGSYPSFSQSVTTADKWVIYTYDFSSVATAPGILLASLIQLNLNSAPVGDYYLDDVKFLVSVVDVASITVTSAGNAMEITTKGGALQLGAVVMPANATRNEVTWSLNKPSLATVDNTGLVTAIADGVVKVTATANDGSGVTGSFTVTISGQSTATAVTGAAEGGSFSLYPNPASTGITVTNAVQVKDITLFDLIGSPVVTAKYADGHLDISNVASGTYFVNIVTLDGNVVVKKIVKY